tara:strand:- start:694 stop:3762 length:3069 start_codon:yes stop_codon:yes gene_type:complete
MFKDVRALKPDVIYVGGDIVHSKTQGISPELIDILSWWFKAMADICDVHIILGNHDGLVLNKHRQDAISPIINAIDPRGERLHLYKKSGTYPTGVPGFNWCVFSCFDEESWGDVRPIDGEINIALFHGGVAGSATDIEWQIEADVDMSFFNDYDFAFLGDIHKMQFLDDNKRIAYCGSTIQQNYGETPGKGYLVWDIRTRDDFDVEFHEASHAYPFVTIDWSGDVEDTMMVARAHPNHSRFRIRASDMISQSEIKQLHRSLKKEKLAHEIVFKYDQAQRDDLVHSSFGEMTREDLRDARTHMKLMRQFYSSTHDFSDETWERVEKLINKFVAQISVEDKSSRNSRWSIKSLRFNNIFSYGKNNFIDFEKLNGITGIFGKNRTGKSSIAGTLMYSLFNTTDRGPIKNLHIINMRKGHCSATVDFMVDGNMYRTDRQSVRHQTRAGKTHAVTHLNLSRLNSAGEIIQDLNGEQRRETEKSLRKLVGTPEDFLLTSLASQGEMNSFIKNRATQRKAILAKFLDLNIFDRMADIAKDESASIKALLKRVPDKDWTQLIERKSDVLVKKIQSKEELTVDLEKQQADLQELQITLATHHDKEAVTEADVNTLELKIGTFNDDLSSLEKRVSSLQDEHESSLEKVEKIQLVKEQFPIQELKEQLGIQHDLEKSLIELEHAHEKEKARLKSQHKSVKILSEVPCGDMFPKCKFIKNSHNDKLLLESQEEKTKEILSNVRASRRALKKLSEQSLSEKIRKYDEILMQESELKLENSKRELQLSDLANQKNKVSRIINESNLELTSMKLRVSDSSTAKQVSAIRSKINSIRGNINKLDSKRMSCSESIALLKKEIRNLKKERDENKHLLDEWKSYEIITNAVSRKGIPLQIMSAQLPIINIEISKILQGVVGFTVELEADPASNDMDIFIDYGDSRRVIECASGMEKMMASLAIRVALINVSALPKTDLLIIDEGFGALDDMNVEACNRLLASLKKWFKNILVISHVDAVKDAVDNVLEITTKGKDARVFYE